MKSLLQQQFQWYLRLLATKIVVNQKEGILFFLKYIYISNSITAQGFDYLLIHSRVTFKFQPSFHCCTCFQNSMLLRACIVLSVFWEYSEPEGSCCFLVALWALPPHCCCELSASAQRGFTESTEHQASPFLSKPNLLQMLVTFPENHTCKDFPVWLSEEHSLGWFNRSLSCISASPWMAPHGTPPNGAAALTGAPQNPELRDQPEVLY